MKLQPPGPLTTQGPFDTPLDKASRRDAFHTTVSSYLTTRLSKLY